MKFLALISSLFVAGAMASSCHPNYPCCNDCNVVYRDGEGDWGVLNGGWCFINKQRCGGGLSGSPGGGCKAQSMGYRCCNHCDVYYTDNDGDWGVQNNDWCGITQGCYGQQQQQQQQQQQPQFQFPFQQPTYQQPTYQQPQQQQQQQQPQQQQQKFTGDNFFENKLYSNYKFQDEVQSSINKLSGDLKSKAEIVKYIPTAAWLAWSGATEEVPRYLKEAGSDTVVFVLYMIPTRDCGANASAGGSQNLDTYKGYVNKIYDTINQYPDSKIVMILEPDTIGNLVTNNSDNCRNVQNMHKQALSYAISKFGTQSNVRVYLDAAHGAWLSSNADRTAQVIKEIVSNAGNGKLRGISTNCSNYQQVYEEYGYHQRLSQALESQGLRGLKFIVDTSRNGKNVSAQFNASGTWCNFKGAGLGKKPQANPDPNMPLLDAYVWIKTPGEADGSSQGSRADPVCARQDSLQTAPDAGSWFHDYFVMLLQNADPSVFQ